jgi:glycosyltransferase involved in cell wall biosynthesis
MARRICICATQIPFIRGGAEILVESLQRELVQRGFETELVTVPFKWYPRSQLIKSCLVWRLLDLTELGGQKIDMIIATRFPSYLIKHPHKVVWLIHQFRQVYDLLGTPFSDFTKSPQDQQMRRMIRAMDNRALSEARALYTISQNTTDRLRRFNDLQARTLYHPPKLAASYHNEYYGDYVFYVGRLDQMKRIDLLIQAMQYTTSEARCLIAGTGPTRESLQALIEQLGLGDKVQLLGYVDDERQVELYANCLAVFYAPYDEDYGYVTLEAFRSRKPVITTSDSGGVLEFVENERNGYVCASGNLRQMAAKIDYLFAHRELSRTMGEAGYNKVKTISWDNVIAKLTAGL